MSSQKLSDAFSALSEIEAFVKVRCTLAFAEETPLRLKAQRQAQCIGEAWTGNLSAPALEAMQHACILKDLLTTFGRRDRFIDWTSNCLAHIAKLRVLLARSESTTGDGMVPFCQPAKKSF